MKIFIVIVLVAMGLTFIVTTNTDPVPLHFFTLTKNVPLPFILIFPIGIALLVFALYHWRQMSKANLISANWRTVSRASKKKCWK
jgi:hypothetical protein